MYHSRMRSEAEASGLQSRENRLLASSLTELLEARKSITTSAELEMLAKRYRMDATKLEQISRVVNTPSIDGSTVVRTTDEHGEEDLTMMVGRLFGAFTLTPGSLLHNQLGSLGRSHCASGLPSMTELRLH